MIDGHVTDCFCGIISKYPGGLLIDNEKIAPTRFNCLIPGDLFVPDLKSLERLGDHLRDFVSPLAGLGCLNRLNCFLTR